MKLEFSNDTMSPSDLTLQEKKKKRMGSDECCRVRSAAAPQRRKGAVQLVNDGRFDSRYTDTAGRRGNDAGMKHARPRREEGDVTDQVNVRLVSPADETSA